MCCSSFNRRYAFKLQLTTCHSRLHHVHHRLAARMLCVGNRMEPALVRVCRNTSATRTKVVVLSVSITRTVRPTKLVCATNAKTRAQEHADRTLTVRLSTIYRRVLVALATRENHSDTAASSLNVREKVYSTLVKKCDYPIANKTETAV